MKIKQAIAGSIFFLTVVLITIFWLQRVAVGNSNQPIHSQLTTEINPKQMDPQISNLLPNGVQVSFAEAQTKVLYSIPQPSGGEIDQVWVSNNSDNPSNYSIAIRYKSGLLLIIHTAEKSPNWKGIIANTPELELIEVNGKPGMGTSPGMTEYNGKQYPYPGSVEWWENGLNITLYSDTIQMEELLKIAETVQ